MFFAQSLFVVHCLARHFTGSLAVNAVATAVVGLFLLGLIVKSVTVDFGRPLPQVFGENGSTVTEKKTQ